MIDRSAQLGLFGRYDIPVVNIAAEATCADFVTPAKATGVPPFALLLHAIGRASLDIPQFRLRLSTDGQVTEVGERLCLSYTVIGAGENLNFSSPIFAPEFPTFLDAYLTERAEARDAAVRGETALRLPPLTEERAFLFITCLPWLRFTFIQHPVASTRDCSIPNIAVGKFDIAAGRVSFPIAVQVHHGLVDGLHIARFIGRVEELMDQAVQDLPVQFPNRSRREGAPS